MSLTRTRLASSAVLTCAALAVALAGCTSDQSEPAGIGNVDMAVTLATPPSGPNEQIDAVNVSLWCAGVDPVLGVPRPPRSSPETFSINTATSQGPEPKNTIGLFEKQGLPAGPCTFTFTAVSNTGNTECTGEVTVMVNTNATADGDVILACIHNPRYGGVRSDGTFNQCAEYREILVTSTTQSIGNLVDVYTEVYDPDGDLVTVAVQAVGACGNVQSTNGDTAASCETVSGCEAVANTVECTGVGLCQIIVAVSDDGFSSCNGLLPGGGNNDAARQTIDVDCTVASGCGNGQLEPGEDCEPPNTPFCDGNCQDIFVCPPEASDPCDQSIECTPQTCAPDANNEPVCSDDPQTGGTCDLGGGESGSCLDGVCVACVNAIDCDDGNDCTDDACVAGSCDNTPDETNTCTDGDFPGTCNAAGVCVGLCTPDPCTSTVECVTEVCNPADASCTPLNDGIDTGCDLGGGPGTGVCDGQGACVQCNDNAQCTGAGETCVNNACEVPVIVCEYAQNFEGLVPGDPPQPVPNSLSTDGWLVGANVFGPDGTTFLYDYFAFPAPNGGPAFSAVAVGEGGAAQGAQQLSIYNDYNNGDHTNGTGNVIEAIVFRERTIVAGDVGTTLTFTFDAKRGNIEGATTALAFVKTLDPGAGFATIDFITEDTTNLPDTWGTFTLSLPIDVSKVGYILQYGFQSRASNSEGSGIFYDNLTFGATGCVGDNGGGGGPSGELTTNGDFETGDFTGWTNFCDNGAGSCTITSDNPNNGQFAANVSQPTLAQNAVIKQERIAAGEVATGDTILVELSIRGSVGPGGVVFLELFSEETGGGVTNEGLRGPFFPTGDWVQISESFTLTGSPDDGITVQIAAVTSGDAGSFVDLFVDDVSAVKQ